MQLTKGENTYSISVEETEEIAIWKTTAYAWEDIIKWISNT
jgi:hypothetical protein